MQQWSNCVIEVIGPSGAGKTTYANRFLGESCGARTLFHLSKTVALMNTRNYELNRDSSFYRNSYQQIWEAKELNESNSRWPPSILGDRLKWYWNVLTLDSFLRQNHFPDKLFLLDDAFVTSFFPELIQLPLQGIGGFLHHMEGRKIINVTTTERAIVRRQLEREKTGHSIPSFQGQNREFIGAWARSTIRLRKEFRSTVANSGLTSVEWVDVRGKWGLRKADKMVASACLKKNLSD